MMFTTTMMRMISIAAVIIIVIIVMIISIMIMVVVIVITKCGDDIKTKNYCKDGRNGKHDSSMTSEH